MTKSAVKSANPYMPLWEHVPDGEPKVFEYEGEKRVYVYGSHDTLRTEYCGDDYVCWSAPVSDLTDWTCHGSVFSYGGSVLFAPDAVRKGDWFYLYAAPEHGSKVVVARSRTPWGPFTDPVETDLGFDPAVLVDDDGRAYAYWGFCKACCGELNEDMATIREGTYRENYIGHCRAPWAEDEAHMDFTYGFFEASSIRRIRGRYVLVYSKMYNEPVPELGVRTDNNGFLSYAVSDRPLDGYVYMGDISFNGGEILRRGPEGEMTYPWGNNHGGLCEVNGQWYIFYHRQTGVNEFSRQAMMEPVEIEEDAQGRLLIGRIIRDEQGRAVASGPVEMTSQGPHTGGIDARQIISAGYACHISPQPEHRAQDAWEEPQERTDDEHGGVNGSDSAGSGPRAAGVRRPTHAYVSVVYDTEAISAPVVRITDGTAVGLRYLAFGEKSPQTVTIRARAEAEMTVTLHAGRIENAPAARLMLPAGAQEWMTVSAPLTAALSGRRAVYFVFHCDDPEAEAQFDTFTFD